MQTHTQTCCYGANAWTILNSIEQSIKQKVESLGTPLKDWDVGIYRGVLTGFNDAFIIDTTKRDAILNACNDEDEKKRTAEIIRPILRGRDIKMYGYNWPGLWIINIHNGYGEQEKININLYPAVKQHLDNYLDKLSARSDKGDTPYNLRNCAYVDEFSKPKIIYPNMTKFLPFVYDEKGYITNQKCFIITGKHIAFLTAFLNSSLFKFCFADRFPELQGKTRELSKIFIDEIPVPQISDSENEEYSKLVNDIQSSYSQEQAIVIDQMIFDMYGLTPDEQAFIGFVDFGEK